MTDKQKQFMLSHGLIGKAKDLGLNPDSLTVAQASDIIAKFYKDQASKKQRAVTQSERNDELNRFLGIKPDWDRYPECGFDRSWAGS